MILLRSLELGSAFEIEQLVQGVEEDPHIIGEQIIFSSELDFEECCESLCKTLSARYGAPSAPSSVKTGEISVASYAFRRQSTEVTLQVVNEGPDSCCNGFIHAQTRWMPA
jgi:hypothetical protein